MIRHLLLLGVLCVSFVTACDNRQAFHEPDPALSRMLQQKRGDPYAASSVWVDGKNMREPLPDTVARDDDDPDAPAPPVTRELLTEGRVLFERTCATCHGVDGDGHSIVATKMHGNAPPSLHETRLRAFTRERMFLTITSGYGYMPAYADMLVSHERWAVASYVHALQLSQHAEVATLPTPLRTELAKEAP